MTVRITVQAEEYPVGVKIAGKEGITLVSSYEKEKFKVKGNAKIEITEVKS